MLFFYCNLNKLIEQARALDIWTFIKIILFLALIEFVTNCFNISNLIKSDVIGAIAQLARAFH